jgi:hypothetical protein
MADSAQRDEHGRFVRGQSGNPAGRGPGRHPQALDDLADRVGLRVLEEVERILDDAEASKSDRREAMRMGVSMCSRRVTAKGQQDLNIGAQVAAWEERLQSAPLDVLEWLARGASSDADAQGCAEGGGVSGN